MGEEWTRGGWVEDRQCRRLGLPVEPDEEETGVHCAACTCVARGLYRQRPTVERGRQHRGGRIVLGSIPGCLPWLRPCGNFFLPPIIIIHFLSSSSSQSALSTAHAFQVRACCKCVPSACLLHVATLVLSEACGPRGYGVEVWRSVGRGSGPRS